MMSMKSISSRGQAASYYMDKDNYYLKGEGKEFSEWWGKGAATLGLQGGVDGKMFEQLLDGRMPDGTQVGLMRDGTIKHRPGYDITLSAPKSLSVLALVGGDKRLIDIHEGAVKATLKEIERLCASARHTQDGMATIENTKNLIVAIFHHDTSRALDPQIHDHCVVMNETLRSDGVWRALASKMGFTGDLSEVGFGERLHHLQIYLSTIYRTEAAFGVKAAGYNIREAGPHGMWEIADVPIKVLDHFSKRRKDIEASIKNPESVSAKLMDDIALYTRQTKQAADRSALNSYWVDEINSLGFDAAAFVHNAKEKGVVREQHIDSAHGALTVEKALNTLANFHTNFTYERLLKQAMTLANGEVQVGVLKNEIENMLQGGQLIGLDRAASRLTTKALIDTESEIVDKISMRRNSPYLIDQEKLKGVPQIVKDAIGAKRIEMVSVSSNRQFELLQDILTAVEGAGKRVHILMPNKLVGVEAQGEIRRSNKSLIDWFRNLGKPQIGQTVKGFLYHQDKQRLSPLNYLGKGKDFIVVDSSHKLSAADLNALLDATAKNEAKLLLLNNDEGVFGGNNIKYLLEKSGVEVSSLVTGDHYQNLHVGLASQSMKLDIETSNTLVVTDSKKRVVALTEEIRNELKYRGDLSRDEIALTSLQPKYVDKTRMTVSDFAKGDMLRVYHRDRPFEDFGVKQTIRDAGIVVLKGALGFERRVKLKSLKRMDFSVFAQSEIKLAVGDRLFATATVNKQQIKKGYQYQVTRMTDKHLYLQSGEDEIKLKHDDSLKLPLAHDYVRLISKAVGKFDKVILDAKSYSVSLNLLNELTAISPRIDVYTDDINKCQRAFDRLVTQTPAMNLVLSTRHEPEMLDNKSMAVLKAEVTRIVESLTTVHSRNKLEKHFDFVIDKLSEREAAFSYEKVFEEVAIGVMGSSNLEAIEKAFQERVKNEELLVGKCLLTTPKSLKFENQTIENINGGIGKLTPWMSDVSSLASSLKGSFLTESQRKAIQLVLTTKDQFVGIQGFAGTGKSTMLSALQDLSGQKILGLAPIHKAVFGLRDIGLTAQTLKSFLVEFAKEPFDIKDKLIVLDEASLVPNKDLSEFTSIIANHGGRAVLQGDLLQYQAIEEGKPWDLALCKSKIDRAYATDIVRQKNPLLKKAVQQVISGNISACIHLVDINGGEIERRVGARPVVSDRVGRRVIDREVLFEFAQSEHEKSQKSKAPDDDSHEPQKPDKLQVQSVLSAAVDDYLSRTNQQRSDTLFIIHAHEDREQAHILIREGLRENGELFGQENNCTQLHNPDLTKAELRQIKQYRDGDIVILDGEYCEVKQVDYTHGIVTLQDSGGADKTWVPERTADIVELYKRTSLPVSSGDLIRATKTDRTRGIIANTEYKVLEINDDKMSLADLGSNNMRILDSNNIKDAHWDYAYTTTGYTAQSATKNSIIDVEFAWRRNLSTIRALYVAVSRAVESMTFYTDDRGKLIEQITSSITAANKTSAIEALTGERFHIKLPQVGDNNKPSPPINETKREHEHRPAPAKKPTLDAEEISKQLIANAEMVLHELLGEPNSNLSSANNLRYGSKGSLSVTLDGKHAGIWHSFETGESGNLLQLIQKELKLSFRGALEYADKLNGGSAALNAKVNSQVHFDEANRESGKSRTQDYAEKLIKQSKPIKGTVVEQYLKSHRGLDTKNSEDIRFHHRVYAYKDEQGRRHYAPAMLAVAKDEQGNQSVQVTYLDKRTANKLAVDADGFIGKRTYGSVKGKHVTLAGDKSCGLSFIAEGVETGKSISKAINDVHVITPLGKENFKNVNPDNLADKVVLTVDNDKQQLLNDRITLQAAKRLLDANKEVYLVMPKLIDNAKTDINDVLRRDKIEGVKDVLSQAVALRKDDSSAYKEAAKTTIEEFNRIMPKDEKAIDLSALSQKQCKLNRDMKAYEQEKVIASKVRGIDREIGP